MPEMTLATHDAIVTLWLPEGGELTPDPANPDLLWWIAPGSAGGFSLAVSASTATPPDGLLAMERELADQVEVERDATVETASGPVHELLYTTERHVARTWSGSNDARRESPGGVEVRAVRRRFWLGAGLSAGYLVPADEREQRMLYDRILESVRVTTAG